MVINQQNQSNFLKAGDERQRSKNLKHENLDFTEKFLTYLKSPNSILKDKELLKSGKEKICPMSFLQMFHQLIKMAPMSSLVIANDQNIMSVLKHDDLFLFSSKDLLTSVHSI